MRRPDADCLLHLRPPSCHEDPCASRAQAYGSKSGSSARSSRLVIRSQLNLPLSSRGSPCPPHGGAASRSLRRLQIPPTPHQIPSHPGPSGTAWRPRTQSTRPNTEHAARSGPHHSATASVTTKGNPYLPLSAPAAWPRTAVGDRGSRRARAESSVRPSNRWRYRTIEPSGPIGLIGLAGGLISG